MIELDHLILFCDIGAPEVAAFHGHGLFDRSGQSHTGQGTANRRISFANAYLELLWVENEADARSDAVAPTHLWDRWTSRASGGCPFGLVFRPKVGMEASYAKPPFPTWTYRPPYLPDGLVIEVGSRVASTEPLLFFLPFAVRRAPTADDAFRQPAGVDEIVEVRLALPAPRQSESIQALTKLGLLRVTSEAEYLAELMFRGPRHAPLDLRPQLPLIFRPQLVAA